MRIWASFDVFVVRSIALRLNGMAVTTSFLLLMTFSCVENFLLKLYLASTVKNVT